MSDNRYTKTLSLIRTCRVEQYNTHEFSGIVVEGTKLRVFDIRNLRPDTPCFDTMKNECRVAHSSVVSRCEHTVKTRRLLSGQGNRVSTKIPVSTVYPISDDDVSSDKVGFHNSQPTVEIIKFRHVPTWSTNTGPGL